MDASMVRRIRQGAAFSFAVSLLATGCSPTSQDTGSTPTLGSGGAAAVQTVAGSGSTLPVTAGHSAAGSVAIATSGNTCPVTIFQQCKACHDGKGTAGTPMGLMTYEDFRAPSHSNPSIPVYQMVEMRVHDAVKPMPMSGMLPASDLAVIDAWVNAGAPDCGFAHATGATAGTSGAATGGAGGAPASTTGATSTGAAGAGTSASADYLSPDGTYFIKEPPGSLPVGPDAPDAEFCFNLVAHNTQMPLPMDPSEFQVAAREFYHQFDFKVPYTQTMVALSMKPIVDNSKVLHHWLLFHIQSDTGTDGANEDEIGLQIGKELVSGWAPGGNVPELPVGVGVEMPKPGGFMTLEIHYYNSTGTTQPDRSGVRMCMTSKIPANVATLTWLGTENINIPAMAQGTATGTCTPGTTSADIHLVYASPHMHKLGSHMKTVINRKGGGTDVVVDQAFAFSDQRTYPTPFVVHAGDTLTTTCTWMNNTPATVNFGTSTTAEMCYNFVYSYPAHSLPNPAGGGIEGSTNMCLK
jgi:hypothetical protein